LVVAVETLKFVFFEVAIEQALRAYLKFKNSLLLSCPRFVYDSVTFAVVTFIARGATEGKSIRDIGQRRKF